MRLLLLGYSDIARRRVLPAAELVDDIQSIEIASRGSEGVSDATSVTKLGKIYRDYGEAISTSECDTVYVSLPNDLHCEFVEAALLADKHVIVDKPATLAS